MGLPCLVWTTLLCTGCWLAEFSCVRCVATERKRPPAPSPASKQNANAHVVELPDLKDVAAPSGNSGSRLLHTTNTAEGAMGRNYGGSGKSWARGSWQQGNNGGGYGGGGRGKATWNSGGRGGGGFGLQGPTARPFGIQARGRGGGGWPGSYKRGGAGGGQRFAPTNRAAKEVFHSQKQGPPRWHQGQGRERASATNNDDDFNDDDGPPPVFDSFQRNSNGGSSQNSARDLLAPAFSQSSSRRRIGFHKATKSTTVFSPSQGLGATAGDASLTGGQQQQQRKSAGVSSDCGSKGSQDGVEQGDAAAGGMGHLARLAEKKIGLPAPGKVCVGYVLIRLDDIASHMYHIARAIEYLLYDPTLDIRGEISSRLEKMKYGVCCSFFFFFLPTLGTPADMHAKLG